MTNSLGGHPDGAVGPSGPASQGSTLQGVGNEAPIAAGRRAVTALFADVAGSTKLGAELDPEDVVEVVGGAVRHFCEVVERYGGTVKDLAGDGILALFGAPSAHEDDPERAVLAGLEIQRVASEHARNIARSAGVDPLGVRVGVETGIVVIAPVGGGSRREMGATGDAVNIAARLQAAAEIGTVLVGPETRRQLGDSMLWGPTTRFELKGKRDMVEGAVALRSRERRVDLDVPLIGRTDQLRELAGVIDDAKAGRGRTVVVVGEAGIGKSRLLTELRRHARDANVSWLDAQCNALDESTPFAAFRGLLWSSTVVVTGEPGSILRRLAEGEPALEDGERAPEAARFGTIEAIAAFAEEAAYDRPVVLCLEDLQWSDPSTLDAVRRLRDLARVAAVVVIATARIVTGHASRTLITEIEADPSAVVLTLGPLSPDQERRLLEELSGHALPPETEAAILEASDGVPLYLREFVRSFGGPLGDATTERPVPPTLDRLILARLDRLSAPARETATALSVLGRDVDLAVARSSVLGDDPDVSLVELVRQGLIAVEGPRCSFSHGLVQEVAYATLLRDRRKELHRSAAEALERSSREHLHAPATLAYHWERAGEPEQAIRYHLAAADAAEAVSGLIEALGHVDAAVRLAERVESDVDVPALLLRRATLREHLGDAAGARDDAERALDAARGRRDRHLELRALEELGSILAGAVDYRAATPLFDEALHLAEVSGDRTELVRCHARLSIAWTNRLRLDRGLKHAERASAIAREERGAALEVVALDALKQVELQIGDFPSAERHVSQVLDFAELRGDLWSAQVCELELGLIATARGRWEDARSHLEHGSALNREVRDDGNMPLHLATRAWLDRLQGRYGSSLGLATQAWDAAREHAHAEWTAWSSMFLGSILLEVGSDEEAARILEEGAAAAERSGADLHSVRCCALLGRARLRCGDALGASDALNRAEDVFVRIVLPADRTIVFAWDAFVDAALIRASLGEEAGQARELESLLRLWERDGFREAVAEGHLGLARLAARARDPQGAARAARVAADEAGSAGLPGTSWRAHAFLSTLPGAAPEHAEVARSIVGDLTLSLTDHTLAEVLCDTLERELGGSTWP